jgi:hypothetical protein
MTKRYSYEPVLSSNATEFLLALTKRRQKIFIRLLYQLAENPGQIGDYSIQDETGREIQVLLIRDLIIAFWADDSAKEMRIVALEEV